MWVENTKSCVKMGKFAQEGDKFNGFGKNYMQLNTCNKTMYSVLFQGEIYELETYDQVMIIRVSNKPNMVLKLK
jgi:hypothetical protein